MFIAKLHDGELAVDFCETVGAHEGFFLVDIFFSLSLMQFDV